MRLTLTITDDLYERVRKAAGAKLDERDKVTRKIKQILSDFIDVGKDGRYLIVEGKNRQQIEAIFQTTIETPEDLASKVEKLNRFGIGDAVRPISDGEALQLAECARFWGQSPAEFVQTTMNRVLDETLNRI